MSTRATDRLLNLQEEHFSRRGFLARVGGVAAGLGLIMAGAAMMPRRVMAGPCCPGPVCGGCPGTIGCPSNCTVNGAPTVCCDSGHVGATETLHQCQSCINCTGPVGFCWCEYDTGNACP